VGNSSGCNLVPKDFRLFAPDRNNFASVVGFAAGMNEARTKPMNLDDLVNLVGGMLSSNQPSRSPAPDDDDNSCGIALQCHRHFS